MQQHSNSMKKKGHKYDSGEKKTRSNKNNNFIESKTNLHPLTFNKNLYYANYQSQTPILLEKNTKTT